MFRIVLSALLMIALATVGFAREEASEVDQSGLIYGTVTMKSGNTYQGVIRWGKEEAFWGDHFNSTKEGLEYERFAPSSVTHNRKDFKIFGYKISASRESVSKVFVCRYGDVRTMELRGGDDVTVIFKDGSKVDINGGSNDIGATLKIWDESVGTVEAEWRRISRVDFMPAPRQVKLPVRRLYGRLISEVETYEGFIQWDKEECLSTDKLDGYSEDGKLSLEMGTIKEIVRAGRHGVTVTLNDGRTLSLEDTNDVDNSNNGIMVEVPELGRVEVPWKRFESLTFENVNSTGPAYDDFKNQGPLSGGVTDRDGRTPKGRIVFDIDEAAGWEILHGSIDDVKYYIPFYLVKSVERKGRSGSLVVLRSGKQLHLEGAADVNNENLGVLVFNRGKEDPTYISWDETDKITFD